MSKYKYICGMFTDDEDGYTIDCDDMAEEYNELAKQIAELKTKLAEKDQDKISFAIAELEKVKDDLLDISSPYWQYFAKSGDAFMTYEDVEQWTKEFIDNQIKQLKEGK